MDINGYQAIFQAYSLDVHEYNWKFMEMLSQFEMPQQYIWGGHAVDFAFLPSSFILQLLIWLGPGCDLPPPSVAKTKFHQLQLHQGDKGKAQGSKPDHVAVQYNFTFARAWLIISFFRISPTDTLRAH